MGNPFRHQGRHVFDSIAVRGIIEGLPKYILGTQYFVSANDGKDYNAGTSPNKPVATIQAAIDLANSLIDWSATPMKRSVIWVEPGVYAENLTPVYYCDIVGLGIRGTDQMAEIHPTTGDCMAGTLLGTGLHNLWFEVDAQDAECLDIGICNNSVIKGCTFTKGANVTGVNAISTENCTHLTFVGNWIGSGQLTDLAYGIYAAGGSNKFFHQCDIRDNVIQVATCGIYIASNCRATETVIRKNFIHAPGTNYGIRVLDAITPGAFVVENDIIIDGAGDAIEHSGGAGYTLYNKTLVNGSYAQETA